MVSKALKDALVAEKAVLANQIVVLTDQVGRINTVLNGHSGGDPKAEKPKTAPKKRARGGLSVAQQIRDVLREKGPMRAGEVTKALGIKDLSSNRVSMYLSGMWRHKEINRTGPRGASVYSVKEK